MAVVTISRQYGSGGDEIAEFVCKSTGYRLFDKQLFEKVALETGLSDQEFVDFCEDSFRAKNFFERLFRPSQPVAQARIWKETTEGVRTIEEVKINEEHALACVRKAVEAAYQAGSFVIVGRGGQMILRDRPGVLHVRIHASLEERLVRTRSTPEFTSRKFSDSVEERRAAQNLIEAHDASSAAYLKRFYSVDWADPRLYHLVINTDLLPVEQTAKLIVQAAQMI